MLLILGLIFGTAVFSVYLIYLLKYKRLIELTKDIPSPPSLPIIGHGHHFIFASPFTLVNRMEKFMDTYGDTLKIWLGPELNIMMNNVEDVEKILSSMQFNDKAGEYKALEPWLKQGLLISSGRKWHQRRKVITPAFHFKILDQFIDIFDRESRLLINNLKTIAANSESTGVNLYDWISLCTLDTICETAMGVSVNAQTNADSKYVSAIKTIAHVLHKRMFDVFCRLEFTYKLSNLAKEEQKALKELHEFTEKVIVQRREELLKENLQQSGSITAESEESGIKRKMAFLDILLQSEIDGKPLSNSDIREEVDTFMFEGHDTTSAAINFVFYNLAVYPECQRKCYEEICNVIGTDASSAITSEMLNNLRYVELCIKETLRLYPSVPLLGRKVTEDCVINGRVIPKGTNIGISPIRLGRNERLFANANIFYPERFDSVHSAKKMNPYAYVPFSAGPRNCIGQKFAILEIKTIVANVLRHFHIDFVGDKQSEPMLSAELILRPVLPLLFKISARN